MYADNDGKLMRDAKQDCDSFYIDAETQSLVFERFFDTCDPDDYIIEVSEPAIKNLCNEPSKICIASSVFTIYGLSGV